MSQEIESPWTIKFVPFSSAVESSFWVTYCQQKLETIQLKEDPVDVSASYGIDGRLECRGDSLSSNPLHKSRVMMTGKLVGYNTLDTFQQTDKNDLLRRSFLENFRADSLPSFVLLTYADLKHHKVLYWFAIPAITPQTGHSIHATKQDVVSQIYTDTELELLYSSFASIMSKSSSPPPYFLFSKGSGCLPLTRENYEFLCSVIGSEQVVFGFVDSPAKIQDELPMGWAMRNLIASLCIHWGFGDQVVQVLSFRPSSLRANMTPAEDASILLHVQIPKREDYGNDYKVVGWEPNARGKPGPRWVNLRPLMDNQHLAVQAADLNLKLMKWRMIPNLDVEKLQGTKALLLGAGTLGCSVARVLLGWGVRKFVIVDNGRVSYSNPVRQSLFNLEDCHSGEGGGGAFKAVAAAEALKKIAADVDAEGICMSIPMPGHTEDPETIEASVKQLDELVQDCDVIYLLTDTRESRWLPTVMAAAHDKMLINAALGLDSWLVIRHGGDTRKGDNVGCYFCNDVVAPENSMKNRTLDQQCTVTRPGLAPIASSMAVELMVSLFHHELRHKAPAPRQRSNFSPAVAADDNSASALGIMPHQIRGSLVSYTMMLPAVPAFSCCTGCSPAVVEAYMDDKVEMVFNTTQSFDGSYLENLSGLTKFRLDAASVLVEGMEEDWDSED
jgi:ubiquitin-like modifier-activating enzyme ATG7